MLAKLRMELEADKSEFGYYQSTNMQGVLMEQISSSYAEQMHEQGLKPYSQYLVCEGQRVSWVVSTFTQEAYRQIIMPLMRREFTEFVLDKKDIHIKICGRNLYTVDKQELLKEFYSDTCDRYLNLEFLTPTAFRSNGKYIIMPDVRYIYQSLMNKYSAASADMEMYDHETLEQLAAGTDIIRYQLRSACFPLEGVKIPSFKGEVRIRVNGTDTMARYARLLVKFGEYSGVGIKTAMGMGGLRMKEWGRENDRQRG